MNESTQKTPHTAESGPSDEATYCGAEYGEAREGECGCPRCAPKVEDEKDTIAEVLGEHWDMNTAEPGEWECDCGYPLGDGTGDLEGRHRAHVAEKVAEEVRRG